MLGKTVYQYGRYQVVLTDNHMEDGRPVPGFAIMNIEFDQVEHTERLYYRAIHIAQICEDNVQKLTAPEDDSQGDLWDDDSIIDPTLN